MHTPARILLIAVTLVATPLLADTIISTPAGGPWQAPTTWQGGEVPGPSDDVVIIGTITVSVAECRDLTLETGGRVSGTGGGPDETLTVGGDLINRGTVTDAGAWFTLEIAGDIHNEGVWSNHRTVITGPEPRDISQTPGAEFTTNFACASSDVGPLTAVSPLAITGDVDLTGGSLALAPGCALTLAAGVLRGELLAAGNELRFESWSYLQDCTLDDVVFVGPARASFSVTVTTRLEVQDTLENTSVSGGGAITVVGNLINHGEIRNDTYSFPVRVHGDLVNHGVISNPQLEFMGAGITHHLTMGPDAEISAKVFLPEFQAATLVAQTPVRFADDLGLGIGTLVLAPGTGLQLTDWGDLGSGTIAANGNPISMTGNGVLSNVTVEEGVFAEQVVVHGDIDCPQGLQVTGTVRSWPYAEARLDVTGLLRVDGEIADGAHPVRVTVRGDLDNRGLVTCAEVTLAGVVDQTVGIGAGLATPAFVLASGLSGSSYQWYRDGAPLAGQTAADLTLVTVGLDDLGAYHCVADADQMSRSIVIQETLDVTDVPASASVTLAQNRPNPFNPATTIAFTLDRPARVTLDVYDVAGRRVERLLAGSRDAGSHHVTWQPHDLPSGTYLYRLDTGQEVLTRRGVLLK